MCLFSNNLGQGILTPGFGLSRISYHHPISSNIIKIHYCIFQYHPISSKIDMKSSNLFQSKPSNIIQDHPRSSKKRILLVSSSSKAENCFANCRKLAMGSQTWSRLLADEHQHRRTPGLPQNTSGNQLRWEIPQKMEVFSWENHGGSIYFNGEFNRNLGSHD